MASFTFTPSARRHIRAFLRSLAPAAGRIGRRFETSLRRRGFDAAQIRALIAIAPAAASRVRTLSAFAEQVAYNSRRLAKLNVPPDEIRTALHEFDDLAADALQTRCAPAREQMQLATLHAVTEAFYQVREAETQALFGIHQAEAEAADLDDLLRRLMGVLMRTFCASACRLLLAPDEAVGSEPVYVRRGSARERLIADPEMRGRYASYWLYPLEGMGAIQLGFAAEYPWLPRELTLLAAAAARCREAIARASDRRTIRRLASEARAAEEEERRRIGRELHDEAGQSLMLLRLKLEMLERDAPPALRTPLAEARGTVENTVTELRRIIAALSPTVLERLGLERALRQLAARFRKAFPAQLRLRIEGHCGTVASPAQRVIYRVAQEGLQNVARHSRATHVNLSVRVTDKIIRLRLSDDGVGLGAQSAWRKPQSFGLTGMRERAELLGGTLSVSGAAAKGVTVILELPNGKDSRTAH